MPSKITVLSVAAILVSSIGWLSIKEHNLLNQIKELQEQNKYLREDLIVEHNISEQMYQENKVLANEVVLRQDITSVIIDAARSYNLDPLLLARIIKSESNFRPNPRHALPNIIGPAGINTKAHKDTKNNPHSYVGNIYTGAEILSFYLEDSDSLTMALTRYKGLSPLGLKQAKEIIKELK